MPSTASATGLIGPIMLDGDAIEGAYIDTADIQRIEVREVLPMGTGGRREGVYYQGPAYPMVKVKHEASVRYPNLTGEASDTIEEKLCIPGLHEAVLWKTTHVPYAGTGSRSEFILPWAIATQVYPADLPTVYPPARFQPSFKVNGTALTIVAQTQVDYDADDPDVGEVWVVDGGTDFKLNSALAHGSRLVVRLVPVLQMYQPPKMGKQYNAQQQREPRTIELLEGGD